MDAAPSRGGAPAAGGGPVAAAGPVASEGTAVGGDAAADLRAIRNRLSRARGQLDAVIRMLDEGRECREVVPQLAAAAKALDRAGFALVARSLRDCATHPEAHGPGDVADLEKLFLSLA